MTDVKLKDLNLSPKELRHITKYLAKKINIVDYKSKSNDETLRSIKTKDNKKQKRIDVIREELKELGYKLPKSELKDIEKRLYNIESKKKLLNSKRTIKYLDELREKIDKLDRYYRDYDDYEYKGIKDIKDLFKLSIDKNYYKPKLVRSGYYVQYESKGDKILTLEEYLALIEKYLRKLIEEYKLKGEWKLQLIAEVSFISLKPGSDETRIMHTRSDNIEIMIGDDNDDIIEELFKSFLQKYEENLQNKMRGSDFEFDGVNFLYYDFNEISLNRGGSYIDSPKWLKNKKSTTNPKNNDYKCFQYAVTLALNLDNIGNDPERISKIKPFIDQYNWKDIDFPATSKDWRKFEVNNEIALNILYVPHNTRKIHIADKSKRNLTCDKQVISLRISNGEKWHYLAVKNFPGLLRGITSTRKEDFYCLNCFRAYRTRNKLEAHKKICENHDSYNIEMPTKDNNIIKYNQGEKSIKLTFVVYADLECLLEKRAHVKIILMNRLLLKLINTYHLVIHYLLIVHSIKQKIN